MKKIIIVFLTYVLFNPPVSYAQLLLNENFSYSKGQLTSAGSGANVSGGNWITNTGTGYYLQVSSGSLSYTGYPSSNIDNKLDIVSTTSSAEDTYRAFTTQNSGSVYASFLLNVTNTTGLTTTGDYFLAFITSSSTSAYAGRVYIQSGTTAAAQFRLGLRYNSSDATVNFSTTDLNIGITYLIVLKYQIVSGATNDIVSLYINPTLSGTEPLPNLTVTSVGTDNADVGRFGIRQGNAGTPNASIDGIRVATTWDALLPAGSQSLTAPIAASATNITATGFTANWGASSTATNYWLDVSSTSDFSTLLSDYNNKDVGNVTTIDLTSLNANTQYYYRVRASNSTATTTNSNTISVTTLLTSPIAIPASDITTTSFNAKWNSSIMATSYKIDVSTSSDFSTMLTNYNNKDVGIDTTAIVSSLTPSTTYFYRVRSSSINNTSSNSNSIMVSTAGLPAPLAPAAKEVTNITTTSFTANWNNSQEATNYSIDVSTDEAFSNILADYNDKKVGLVTMLTVSGLTPSTNYYYRVRALNSGGTSPNSNSILVTTLLSAPVAIAATNITQSGFTANWNASTNATNYWLDVSANSNFSSFVTNYDNMDAGNVTSAKVTSLSPNLTYYYRVSASNNNGASPYSNTVTVTTIPTVVNEIFSDLPSKYDIYQNYPNPFNPSTIIKYALPQESTVHITIIDILGREVTSFNYNSQTAGLHSVQWNGNNYFGQQVAGGVYIYTINAKSISGGKEFHKSTKLVLMK